MGRWKREGGGENEFNKLSVQMPFCYPCIQSAGSERALGPAVYGGANLERTSFLKLYVLNLSPSLLPPQGTPLWTRLTSSWALAP